MTAVPDPCADGTPTDPFARLLTRSFGWRAAPSSPASGSAVRAPGVADDRHADLEASREREPIRYVASSAPLDDEEQRDRDGGAFIRRPDCDVRMRSRPSSERDVC